MITVYAIETYKTVVDIAKECYYKVSYICNIVFNT